MAKTKIQPRKYPSGSKKRKLKDKQETGVKRLQQEASKHFKSNTSTVPPEPKTGENGSPVSPGALAIPPSDFQSVDLEIQRSDGNENDNVEIHAEVIEKVLASEARAPTEIEQASTSCKMQAVETTAPPPSFSVLDPSTWPLNMTLESKKEIALQNVEANCSYDGLSNKMDNFIRSYYTGKKPNGESFCRDWLRVMGAGSKNESVVCMPCCLFGSRSLSPWGCYGTTGKGYNDFHNSSRGITSHEESDAHFENIRAWKGFCKRVEAGKDIVGILSQIDEEKRSKWRQILYGILDAVMFLAQHNMAFRGTSDNIQDENCGNFLGLIKLLSKHNDVLKDHVQKLKKKTSYLSPEIQNEFIEICGDEVKENTLQGIRKRKYFGLMLDSTPDVSKMDQLSQVIRSVECSKLGCKIHENFIDFIPTTVKTGIGITNVIIDKLAKDGLELSNCRGQGYDNGSNMSGIYSGVQARLLKLNKVARFVPCITHSLNRVGVNVNEKNSEGRSLLGRIQNIYKFFARSTSRWEILKKHVKANLKGHCDTRWSSKAVAVKALRDQFPAVIAALEEISESEKFEPEVNVAAENHIESILNFKFMLGLTVWNKVLWQINSCNVVLQDRESNLHAAKLQLKILCDWMKSFQIDGFEESVSEAEILAEIMNINKTSGFGDKRKGRGINSKYNSAEEVARAKTEENIDRFRREFFDAMMEKMLEEMDNRFTRLKETLDDFQFLFGKGLAMKFPEKAEHVRKLCAKYPSDFDVTSFLAEMRSFQLTLHDHSTQERDDDLSPLDVLNIIYSTGLEFTYRNAEIALRIFLTMPVTVASNERSFSKLKLIKNYLRSSMSQERLNGLAILSIEREIASEMKFDKVIDTFVNKKCRRIKEI